MEGVKDRIGGLVGHNYTSSQIIDSYSSAVVYGQHKLTGGFVGINTAKAVIARCYSTGPSNKMGFVGTSHNGGTVSDCFWDMDSSGQTAGTGTGRTGKTTYQMKSLSTFTSVGWDVNASGGTWKMLQGDTYPLLSWEPLPIHLPSGIFFQPAILIENQPAGMFAGKVHALLSGYRYTPGMGIGDKVVIVRDANHAGVSFLRGENLTVTGVGNGGTVNGRIVYRPRVDKGGIWIHREGKGSWWEAADRQVGYALVGGHGSTHNSMFSIDADGNLRTLGSFDYESTPSLQVRVRVTKGSLGAIEKELTVPLWDDPNEYVESSGQTAGLNQQSAGNQTDSGHQAIIRTPIYQVPIVSTQVANQASGGSWRFGGKVLTNGNFPIFERGFQISTRIDFSTFLRLTASIDSNATAFTAFSQVEEFSPDRVYYYRAYARNAVGGNYGAIRKFTPRSQGPGPWWGQMPSAGGGWRTSDWFGTFRRQSDSEWIYHARLGWAYALTDGQQGLWLWMMDEGWLWTQPGTHPYLFRHRSGSWLYLMGSEAGKPVFFDFSIGLPR